MRLKFLIGLSIFALAVIAVLLWRHSPEQMVTARPMAESAAQKEITQPTNSASKGGAAVPPVPLSREEIAIASNRAVELREHELQQMVENANVPIQFYGQVIDQDDQPLSGVHVKMIAVHNVFFSPESIGESNLITEKISDLAGRFEWMEGAGSGIDIESIKKNGYDLEPAKMSYKPVSGNFQNPIIFKMWSTNKHEPLITGSKNFQIKSDGTAYFIDLATDTISESSNGDLKVWVLEKSLTNGFYDWSCGVSVINGGLLEEINPNSAMYVAPDGDYLPKFELQQQFKGDPRCESGHKRFYLSLKNRQEFGRMSIEIFAPYNDKIPGLIRLSYAINPSGSRILR